MKKLPSRVPGLGHGSELIESERPAMQTGTFLPEKDGAAEEESDQQSNRDQDGAQHQESNRCQRQIQETLHQAKSGVF